MQSISIAGFDHPSFTDAVRGIDNITKLFSVKYPAISPPRPEQIMEQHVLTFDNRYVTTHTQLPSTFEEIPFESEEDPNGVIRKELQSRGVRIEDNVVEYYRAENLAS